MKKQPKLPMDKPRIEEVCLVAEDILMLTVQEGAVTGGVQIPYVPQPGETTERDRDIPALVYIVKDGKRIGVKVEDDQRGTQRFPFESFVGERLDTAAADSVESYRIDGKAPRQVWRKTKPNNMVDPDGGFTFLHRIYLVCDKAITEGTETLVRFAEGIFDRTELSFRFVPEDCRTEAIQINQVGYRPDDPSKKAYLSQWMGLGGGIAYDTVPMFYLIDEQGRRVFSGSPCLRYDGEAVPVGAQEISGGCSLYELDFSAFCREGTYRVLIPEFGCSFPFVIGETGWKHGFDASMSALFCQRSGIVTGEPYTRFSRPRCYHPDDGKIVYQSGCSLFESGNGLNCYGTDTNNFGNLLRKATDTVVENAWGGYFDACDWDRRIQHLKATRLHTELYLMLPEVFSTWKLPIPESGNGIPDILNEGLWNLAFYRRLQLPDGGIRGGIEQEEHPILGQCGWQDTWKAYAYAPDFWSSYYYASVAARMAFALLPYAPELSHGYRESAERAFAYAEHTYAEAISKEGHKWTRRAHAGVRTERENAAVDLFRLTSEQIYENVYRNVRNEQNHDANFVYATLPDGMGNEKIKGLCREAIRKAADRAIETGKRLPYHLTSEDLKTDRAGAFSSFCTIPRNTQLIRAHFLTGEPQYLAAAIASADFGAGANPDNLCFTTGVGMRWPENVLHHDSRMTGQEAPAGITVFGPQSFNYPDDAFPRLLRSDFLYPGAYVWPSFEGYLDIYRHPCVTEYTVQSSIGPNAYQWGYFAARASSGKDMNP